MEKGKKRRKDRAKELSFWEAAVQRALHEVRAEFELAADDRIPDAWLVAEVMGLGDPHAVPGLDAVVPGGNVDAAKNWMRERLGGRADTADARLELARRIAPLPDHDPGGGWGMNRRLLERAITYDVKERPRSDRN